LTRNHDTLSHPIEWGKVCNRFEVFPCTREVSEQQVRLGKAEANYAYRLEHLPVEEPSDVEEAVEFGAVA
jgi:hypothetical protein